MQINSRPYRTIWVHPDDEKIIQVIDQRYLPHRLEIKDITTVEEAAIAIREMWVRGAPLIGATAAFGMYLATLEAPEAGYGQSLRKSADRLLMARPTAINLRWAVNRMMKVIFAPGMDSGNARQVALAEAMKICDEDVAICQSIGQEGLPLIEAISIEKEGQPVNILTHCNAGWLACVDWGTATSPIYQAHEKGIPVHVWVDETRPRNQGASLTAWELGQNNIPYTVIVDNAGGHLMQRGMVDLVITGTDRTAQNGDVANKIGTYLKALAARDNDLPFYVALPSTSIDWAITDGIKEIPVEERSADEVKKISGWGEDGMKEVLLTPAASKAANYAFDVTPARLVTGLITERGICKATKKGILKLFPELQEALTEQNDYAED